MFKRSISLMMVIAVLLAVLAIPPAAAEVGDITAAAEYEVPLYHDENAGDYNGVYTDENGNIFYYRFDSYDQDCVFITCAEIVSPDVVIPAEIDGCSVTGIGAERYYVRDESYKVFRNCTVMKTLVIPDTVIDIGRYAFEGCTALESVVIPGSPTMGTDIDYYAFSNCPALRQITLGYNINSINDCAFGYAVDVLTEKAQSLGDFTITGYRNTAAETYAKENGFTFIPLSYTEFPAIIKFESVDKGVKLSWEPFEGNLYYRVYRAQGSSDSWERLATVKGTSYVDATVDSGAPYLYTIRCVDEKGNFTSGYFRLGWRYEHVSAPEIFKLAYTNQGLNIYWKRHWTGGLMRVYRKTEGGSWQRLTDGIDCDDVKHLACSGGQMYTAPTLMYFTDTTAKKGVKYTYTLRLIDEEQKNFLSTYNSGVSLAPTDCPEITGVDNVLGGVKISWKKFSGAAQYRVYRRYLLGESTFNDWEKIAAVSGTSYTDTAPALDNTYRLPCVYTIRALDSKGNFISDYNREGWWNIYNPAPEIKSLSNTAEGVKLTWDIETYAYYEWVYYRVYRKSGSSSWQRLDTVEALGWFDGFYTDTTAKPGVKYTYTLRQVNASDNAFLSAHTGGRSITYVAAPKITSVTNTDKGAKITWNKSAGANFYRIYYKNANGGWTRLASKYLTEYVDTSVKDGETRVYTVRCLDAKENFVSGFDSNGYTNTYYAPPVIKSITDTASGVVLSWNQGDGAGEYRVYRRTDGSSWMRLAQTGMSSYTDTAAQKGVQYTYTLRIVTHDGSYFLSDYLSGTQHTYSFSS